MKRFLRSSTKDYPEGFGVIRSFEDGQNIRTIRDVKRDYAANMYDILQHGLVLYPRSPHMTIPVPRTGLTALNIAAKGAVLHDGTYGHQRTEGVSFVSFEESDVATICADTEVAAQATGITLEDPEFNTLFEGHGEMAHNMKMQSIDDLIQNVRDTLSVSDDNEILRSLLGDVHAVVRHLDDVKIRVQNDSRPQLFRFARTVQQHMGDAIIPVDWNAYWLVHMDDRVVHGRDVRTHFGRKGFAPVCYCAQKDFK